MNKLWVSLIFSVLPIALFMVLPAGSLNMTNRSIIVSTGVPSAVATHNFRFDIPSTNVMGSLVFEYCINSPLLIDACTPPSGLDTSAANLISQGTNVGFSIDGVNTTTNRLVLTRPPAAGIIGSSLYDFSDIINHNSPNQTVFVRISSYASADGTGTFIDEGSVAFSTGLSGLNVGLTVPPYITFCVGQTVASNCASTTGSMVSFGELSRQSTSTVTTQMAAATNDFDGYNIFVEGQTLTSGNNIVSPLQSPSSSVVGQSQFGLNLSSNTSPSVGANTSGLGTGVVSANYSNPNSFRFVPGELIASSSLSTEFNVYTVSYIANVSASQAAGFYATTLTYTAVATF